MYNKLFTKILDSSIWLEPAATRIVWLMFLAVMDEDGFVQFAAVGNVAGRARVELEEATAAIAVLEAPDQDSSDPSHEGRRIERVPGGWMVLNAERHRELVTRAIRREKTRLRVEKHRTKTSNAPVTPTNAPVRQSEADSQSDSDSQSEAGKVKTLGDAARHRFVVPTREELSIHSLERRALGKPEVDPDEFMDFYDAQGWKLSNGRPMVKWQAAWGRWERNAHRGDRNGSGAPSRARKVMEFGLKLKAEEERRGQS